MHNKLYANAIKSRLGERGQTQGAYSTYVTKCEYRCSTKYRLDCKSVLTQKLQIKSFASSGKFSGYASVFNNIDSYNDVVLPGAFKSTTPQSVKLLWQHDPKLSLAKSTLCKKPSTDY